VTTPTQEELVRLREITRMTGYLTNVQIRQLQMWPRIVLAAHDASVEFDPDTHEVEVDLLGIDYNAIWTPQEQMQLLPEMLVKEYQTRLQYFDKCVKYLLGNEYGVTVKFKGKVLGRSPPTAPVSGAHLPDFERAEEWLKKTKK